MFGKVIGAVVGSKIAKSAGGIGGPGGAILGLGAATLAKRMSLPVMIALGAGGYFLKKRQEKKTAAEPATNTPPQAKTPPKVKSSAM